MKNPYSAVFPHRLLLAAILLLVALVLAPAVVRAAEFEKNIMTGGSKGTYIQIGRNISELVGECGQSLNVQESAGSLENLVAVKNRLFTQFGIVQSDVLEYVRTYSASDADLRRALFGVRIMFPLYNEEVHVLATREVNRLQDLSGKKVAIGKADSGTWLTASLVLDILRVNDADRLAIASDEALPKLVNGEIDALFYVAGAPTKLFADPGIDGSKFHLLDITDAPLLATYTKSEIPGGTYPFQPEPVSGIAVKAVLMTYDYDPAKSDYHKDSCRATSDIANLVLANLDRLRETGHPKWKEVDLAALPPGWQVGNCVKVGMSKDYKPACKAPVAARTAAAAENAIPVDQEYLRLLRQRLDQ